MSEINRLMGVCPQHDVLFADLTAVEHIQLYAGLKGVPQKDWPMLIEDRLKMVLLL
jgi:ABC-type multidrug transport system ATPase subunit